MEFTATDLVAALIIVFVIAGLVMLKYSGDKSVKETQDGLINGSKSTSVDSEERNRNVKKTKQVNKTKGHD